ncbi:tetratricopeptide repeat-containing protein [Sandarakinorhabdus sp.]|uniref:tetratricopeptide repeat-containing protein n=1 Tax=Sandarakinorhabdus sp. TaxID=1916663 RepID=UPI00286DA0B3|nr:tetratricopeptide repeat-containing protein [Sandarakinorhabdus sp.]
MSVERARDAIKSGDLLGAYDLARAALADGQQDAGLRFIEVLALARMGETERAFALFQLYDLAAAADEDVLALGARLLKDRAVAATGPLRAGMFREASEAYHAAHARFGGYFSLINAASLAQLAGDQRMAQQLARHVLAMPDVAAAASYFAAVTAAEAWLLLNDRPMALAATATALLQPDANLGARASTVRQLVLLRAHGGVSQSLAEDLCAQLRPPPVLFYAGHMFANDPAAEAGLAARIEAVLDATGAKIAYGALACGADILCAEALLRRGAELHVVLPFPAADFMTRSVLPGGSDWAPRFDAALGAARTVTFASEAADVGDPEQINYGNSLAMGMTLLRSAHLHTSAQMLAVWDGTPSRGIGGTGDEVQRWQKMGHAAQVIAPGAITRPALGPAGQPGIAQGATRCQRAILFTDYAGFSKLGEPELPGFWADVMGRVAAALAAVENAIDFRNSWGDAVFAVLSDVEIAARVALDIVSKPVGDASEGGMRVGLHFGPVYRMVDPITGQTGFIGTEVTRAARIEPVTPVGQVYVTQPFAAMLALANTSPFKLEYAGQVNLAKRYGTMALYRLSL